MTWRLEERDPTEAEEAEEKRIREELRKKNPNASVLVRVRFHCTALADTHLPCDLAPGHSGDHYVASKDHSFKKDCRPEIERWMRSLRGKKEK